MPRLNQDNDMLERMELDLSTKAQAAFVAAGVQSNVHGVFSLDDLENKTEQDLCNLIAVGVGYAGAEPSEVPAKPGQPSAPGGNTVKVIDFVFHVILAVPHGKDCVERYSATKLLTILRRSIQGTPVDGDETNRTWSFTKEFPNVNDSTDTMLYYSQVWAVRIPSVR